jgi:ADP-ribose pyrophosphatase
LNFVEDIQALNPWVTLVKRVCIEDSIPFIHLRTHDYVTVIALHRNKLVLVKQFRIALNIMTLELPSGIIDMGQSPITAALDELEEEAGLIPESEPILLPIQYIDSARLESRVYPYFFSNTRLKENWTPEPNLERFWMERDEIANAVKFGKLTLSSHSGMLAYLLVSGDL